MPFYRSFLFYVMGLLPSYSKMYLQIKTKILSEGFQKQIDGLYFIFFLHFQTPFRQNIDFPECMLQSLFFSSILTIQCLKLISSDLLTYSSPQSVLGHELDTVFSEDFSLPLGVHFVRWG